MFLATSPGQRIHAFANQACNPGADKTEYLGEVGGGCKSLDDAFTAAPMQSVLFYVPVICDIANLVKDLAADAEKDLKEILAAA